MLSKVKLAQLCALISLSLILFISEPVKSQNAIGMELLIPIEAQIDSNQVKIRSPFADKESIKEDIYLESHYIETEKVRNISKEVNINKKGEARKEKVVMIVHYL